MGGGRAWRIWLGLWLLFAVTRGYDYFSDGAIWNLMGLVGFLLLAFGEWRSRPTANSEGEHAARVTTPPFIIGMLLVLGSFALKYLG